VTDLPADLPSVDLRVMSQLREVMEDEFADLLQTYLDGVPQELQRIRAAVAAGRAEVVVGCSHALKGSSANLGVFRLAQLFRDLETVGRSGELGEAAHNMVGRIEAEFAVVQPLLESALRQ